MSEVWIDGDCYDSEDILEMFEENTKLREENQKLKKAIVYSRNFYYLPQMVLDVFSVLVPTSKYDLEADGSFYNEVMEGE